jgi:hypothetical protein
MQVISAHSPKYNADGTIDLQVVFSDLGEVPFTASSSDDYDIWTKSLAGDYGPITAYVAPIQTPEQIIASLTSTVQAHLDSAAKASGYDGILSAASYAGDSHPPFNIEGVAFRDWRGAVWAACYGIMADVQNGSRSIPDASILIAELPALVLP